MANLKSVCNRPGCQKSFGMKPHYFKVLILRWPLIEKDFCSRQCQEIYESKLYPLRNRILKPLRGFIDRRRYKNAKWRLSQTRSRMEVHQR